MEKELQLALVNLCNALTAQIELNNRLVKERDELAKSLVGDMEVIRKLVRITDKVLGPVLTEVDGCADAIGEMVAEKVAKELGEFAQR